MNIIDHVSLGVPDIETAKKFYDPVLKELGIGCMVANDSFAAYGTKCTVFINVTC